MSVQIQSASSDVSSAAASVIGGKSGKQGVFANLFKALAQGGLNTATKTGKAAGTLLKASPLAATAGKQAEGMKASKGKLASAPLQKAEKEEKVASARKTVKEPGTPNAQAVALAALVPQTSTASAGKVSDGHEQNAEKQDKGVQRKQEKADRSGKQNTAPLQQTNVARAKQENAPFNADSFVPEDTAGTAANQAKARPVVQTLNSRAIPAEATPAESSNNESAKAHAGNETARAGKANAQQPAAAPHNTNPVAAPAHETKITAQGKTGEIENVQRDADAIQRIRDEIAAMPRKTDGQASQSLDGKARGSEGQFASLLSRQSSGMHANQTSTGNSNPNAGVQSAQAIANAALAAADNAQGNGHEGSGRQDSTDARIVSGPHSDARPQQAFDLQQQAVARMAQPARPLEAMQLIAHSAANGTTKLELQLEPAHLGKVHVSLQTDASKQLQMHLTVEHAMTRQVIEQHMPALRAALEQQGLNLSNFSLHTGSQHQQQEQSSGHAAGMPEQSNNYAPLNEAVSAPSSAPAFASSRLSIHI